MNGNRSPRLEKSRVGMWINCSSVNATTFDIQLPPGRLTLIAIAATKVSETTSVVNTVDITRGSAQAATSILETQTLARLMVRDQQGVSSLVLPVLIRILPVPLRITLTVAGDGSLNADVYFEVIPD